MIPIFFLIPEEFRDKWPGQPQDLKAMEIEMENSRTAASFTWKPPYDGMTLIWAMLWVV